MNNQLSKFIPKKLVKNKDFGLKIPKTTSTIVTKDRIPKTTQILLIRVRVRVTYYFMFFCD